jgi:hypothetical protein
VIEIWSNKITEAPSVQVGTITMDLGKASTAAQDKLFALVMNHPDAIAAGAVRAPMTPEIASAFVTVVDEHLKTFLPKKKRMPHTVEVTVQNGKTR